MDEHCTFLQAGELSAIIGDDTPRGPGGRQYSGIWSLIHTACSVSPFQGAYAGLIAGAHRGSGPRLERLGEASARLVRTPTEKTPAFETRGSYTLTPPHYVDYTFEAIYQAGAQPPDPAVFTWCSYMNSPLDRSIHFIENDVWTTLAPVIHGEAASVFPKGLDDAHRESWERRAGEARFAEQATNFHHSFSGKTFDYPFYFGLIHGMAFLLMADHHRDFRFYISPSGAGHSAVPGLASPAWDFTWLNWRPQPGQTRTLHVRLAFFMPHHSLVNSQVWQEWSTFRQLHPVQ